MPNAKDLKTGDSPKRFLLIGKFGAGKTTQLLTLPGKKFLYAFDPNTLSAIEGYDIDYESFLPDQLRMRPQPLKKDLQTKAARAVAPKAYLDWEKDFESRLANGFFEPYSWVGWDSWTTFADIIMDHLLFLAGRAGQFPQQDDWGPQMVTLNNIFRTAAGMGKGIFCTAHEELIKNEVSGQVQNQILITGKLRQRLPLLFSEILHCTCEIDRASKEPKYLVQTKPDRENPNCRTSMKGIEVFSDVTIRDFRRPEAYGLGALLKAAKGGNYGNLRQPTESVKGAIPATVRT